MLRDNLIHIPEKGDGILIETNPNLENDNNQNTTGNNSKDNKRLKTKQDKRAKRKEKEPERKLIRKIKMAKAIKIMDSFKHMDLTFLQNLS